MTVPVPQGAGQNSAYRPSRWHFCTVLVEKRQRPADGDDNKEADEHSLDDCATVGPPARLAVAPLFADWCRVLRDQRLLAGSGQQLTLVSVASEPSVGIGAEDALVCARFADRTCRLDVAERYRLAPVGERARDFVQRQLAAVSDGSDAAKRAAAQRRADLSGRLWTGRGERTRHKGHGSRTVPAVTWRQKAPAVLGPICVPSRRCRPRSCR
jgi:hypothetical protein